MNHMKSDDLISRSALLEELRFKRVAVYGRGSMKDIDKVIESVETAPAVDAEPVRHESNTTFIATSNLDSYADRIIVGQNTLCKVYYADEPVRHGRWVNKTERIYADLNYRFDCSACSHIFYAAGIETFKYCPNCGAKMDAEVDE